VPVSVLTSRSIAVVFYHPLSLLHLRLSPAQVPADCLHASRVWPYTLFSRVSCASKAGRTGLGSPETFRNPTWTKTKGEMNHFPSPSPSSPLPPVHAGYESGSISFHFATEQAWKHGNPVNKPSSFATATGMHCAALCQRPLQAGKPTCHLSHSLRR
jgi:hypothetical protein